MLKTVSGAVAWLLLLGVLAIGFAGMPAAVSAQTPLITSAEAFADALMNAKDGDTLLVGDITFQPMPAGMILIPKNVTVKSGKATNAVFTNATFACNGTTTDSSPLTVRFENIDFRGDLAGVSLDPEDPPNVSSDREGIMHTMCAAIFRMNVNAVYEGCTFEGYHYGYGGVFNAVYSTENDQCALSLSLKDCVFRNNAAGRGGCLYLSGFNRNIRADICRCVFEDNVSATGGAIWAQDADVSLRGCSLTGNRLYPQEKAGANGGALVLYGCGAELDGCLFAGNEAPGAGAGVFCEISPFRTLIMENCTVIGNRSPHDEGIAVSLAETNYETKAAVHVFFSSLIGAQDLAGHADLFGCLLAEDGIPETSPCAENGYCLRVPTESAEERGWIPETPGHVILPQGEYRIPKTEVEKVAGGRFAGAEGEWQIGSHFRASDYAEGSPGAADVPPIVPVVAAIGALAVCAAAWLLPLCLHRRKASGTVDPGCREEARRPVPEQGSPAPLIVKAWFTKEEIGAILRALPGVQTLTGREREVFTEVLEGKKQKEIAADLGIGVTTVKDFYRKINDKLGFSNREELLRRCSEFVSG